LSLTTLLQTKILGAVMSKTISLAMLLGMIITLSIVFTIVRAQQAPGWQIKLNNYLPT
jgi:hypothetical protein